MPPLNSHSASTYAKGNQRYAVLLWVSRVTMSVEQPVLQVVEQLLLPQLLPLSQSSLPHELQLLLVEHELLRQFELVLHDVGHDPQESSALSTGFTAAKISSKTRLKNDARVLFISFSP